MERNRNRRRDEVVLGGNQRIGMILKFMVQQKVVIGIYFVKHERKGIFP